ncbi:hypothetical protein IP87_08300 [beta proteobacterium AAP121]|nr:hypothetical protein IP80_18450 [beta proteobacterium AAP65]KPF98437.1 hypothetical protein IP87_08300 [beta proteobacterium AAP121]
MAVAGLATVCCGPVAAQTSTALRVTPSLDLQLGHSRVVDATGARNDDLVLLRPGLRLSKASGLLSGNLEYSLGLEKHSNEFGSEVNHQLSASLLSTLVPNRLTVSGRASYGRRSISAFGTQYVPGSTLQPENTAEVGSLSIAPVLRGPLADVAEYDLRWTGSATNQRRSLVGDSISQQTSLSLRSAGNTLAGWVVQAERSSSDFRASGDTVTERASVSLVLRPDIELELQLRAGTESQEGLNVGRGSRSTTGGDLRWRPGPRTQAQISVDQRVFGRSSRASFDHRFARASFRLSTTEDLLRTGNPTGLDGAQTLYEQFFAQAASEEPDLALREQLVRTRLAQQGLDPNATVGGGFVVNGTSVQRRHDLSWAYNGLRMVMSLQAYAARTSRIDLLGAGEEPVKQRGYTASLSHRLGRDTSLGVQGSRNRTKAQDARPGTDLKSLNVTFTDRLGRWTTLQLTARYSVFNSVLNAYRESAATATLTMRY